MASLLDKYGAYIGKQLDEGRPDRALSLLRLAYGSYAQVQKHFAPKHMEQARKDVAVISMDLVRQSLAHPERTAIVNVFLPAQILQAMGVYPQVAEGQSCYLAGAHAQGFFIEQAGLSGAPETLCSYHRALTGMALSNTLRPPRFVANTSLLCDANTITFRLLAKHYGVPHFSIDVPVGDGAAEVTYVADQIREFAAFVQDVMGECLDDARLSAVLDRGNKSLAAYQRYLSMLEGAVLHNDATSEMYTLLVTHLLLGDERSLAFFEQLERDVAAAPRTGEGGRRPRRIFWAHTIPFYQEPVKRFFATANDGSFENQLLMCDMNVDALEPFDPAAPYTSLARRLVSNSFNGSAERRVGRIIEYASRLKAEGIVYFCHWGCRSTSGAVRLMTDAAAEAGIPLLVLDGDGCDASNTSDGQVATRLQAFAELIDAQRKAVEDAL